MKNTLIKLTAFLTFIVVLISCTKDCEPQIATCNEKPPTDELCEAYFERWFYDKDKNKCEQIGYSGCSQKGFETKEECKECECN
jgi:hypothetical protein